MAVTIFVELKKHHLQMQPQPNDRVTVLKIFATKILRLKFGRSHGHRNDGIAVCTYFLLC